MTKTAQGTCARCGAEIELRMTGHIGADEIHQWVRTDTPRGQISRCGIQNVPGEVPTDLRGCSTRPPHIMWRYRR